jgi:hypothetical protein
MGRIGQHHLLRRRHRVALAFGLLQIAWQSLYLYLTLRRHLCRVLLDLLPLLRLPLRRCVWTVAKVMSKRATGVAHHVGALGCASAFAFAFAFATAFAAAFTATAFALPVVGPVALLAKLFLRGRTES